MANISSIAFLVFLPCPFLDAMPGELVEGVEVIVSSDRVPVIVPPSDNEWIEAAEEFPPLPAR